MASGISFRDWMSQFVDDLGDDFDVTGAVSRGGYYAYLGLWHTLTSRYPIGTNVYERDWDALLILDSCRVDAMRAVADEYDFIEGVESVRSVGSTSHEWVAKTFTGAYRDDVADTGYVTGNGYLFLTDDDGVYPPSGGVAPFGWPRWDVLGVDDFAFVDYVWSDGGTGDLGTVPSHAITDRAVAAGRERDADRLIVHYMQPHGPYVADAVRDRELRPNPGDYTASYRSMIEGDASNETVWNRYVDNLRTVLDEVELLLSNLDADRVAISADHGELLGEFGLANHPDGFPVAPVKRVPWAVTSATDTGDHEPETEATEAQADVQEHLRDLGYAI